MKIRCIIPSVQYSDFLARSIHLWKQGTDDLVIVTSSADDETKRLCDDHGVEWMTSDRWYVDGAVFNKAGALADGWRHQSQSIIAFGPGGDWWGLLADADVIPPENWRELVDATDKQRGLLYGARRQTEAGQLIPDATVVGCFMLFHAADPKIHQRSIPTLLPRKTWSTIFDDWHNAGSYDSEFERRWGRANQRFIDGLTLTHQGEHGVNWAGRGNDQGMIDIRKTRIEQGGWMHERLVASDVK